MQEDAIVWLDDIDRLDYVRPITGFAYTRCGRPRFQGRLVGYATVSGKNTGVPRFFDRRCFYLTPDDPYSQGCPTEAVDPRTVAPNVPGEQTERVTGPHVAPWPVTPLAPPKTPPPRRRRMGT